MIKTENHAITNGDEVSLGQLFANALDTNVTYTHDGEGMGKVGWGFSNSAIFPVCSGGYEDRDEGFIALAKFCQKVYANPECPEARMISQEAIMRINIVVQTGIILKLMQESPINH